MKIVVLSCDKDEDLFYPFKYCLEKYYPTHPEVIYATETIKNPYYKTICKNYPLEVWSKRIRETLKEIEDNEILLMVDDVFIRSKVDTDRIEYARKHLKGNTALFNFEKEYDDKNIECSLDGFKLRKKGSDYELSLLCGLWDRKKLIDVLSKDCDPWSIEYEQDTKHYDYFINSGDFIIDWGYKAFQPVGVVKGKWSKEVMEYFKKEGIEVDYGKREIFNNNNTLL